MVSFVSLFTFRRVRCTVWCSSKVYALSFNNPPSWDGAPPLPRRGRDRPGRGRCTLSTGETVNKTLVVNEQPAISYRLPCGSTDLRWTSPNAGTTAGARRTVLRPPRRPSWRFAARVTVAMLQAGMLFQFGFDCCLVRYLLAALLERDGFVLVLRSRESFCVSLLWPHTCCVCRVRVHPGHRAGRICTCSTLFSGLNTS